MEARTLKILAIDDRQDNLTALKAVLPDALPGVRVFTALSGPKGLELALAEDPDVILLDVVMPGMDGFAVCESLKADERLRTIPVVFLTALKTDRESRVRALEVGAEAFLPKPWDEAELVAQVRAMAKIKAANSLRRLESTELEALVAERTTALERELTERKRAEDAIVRLNEQQALILNSAAEGILGLDLNGLHTFVNPAAARMLGYAPEELVGRHSHSAWHHTRPDGSPYPKEECPIYAAYRDGAVHSGSDELFWRKDGTSFPSDYASTPITANGAIVGAVVTFTDITERRQAEEVQAFLARTGSGTAKEPFFDALARYLASSLEMDFVCIDRLDGDGLTAHTLAVWCDGEFQDNVSYALKDTPCGDVVGNKVCCFPASVCQFFPRDDVLKDLRAESYVGVTLFGDDDLPIGLIAVIRRSPLANTRRAEAILQLVAVRAAAELERLDAREALTRSESRLREAQRVAGVGSWEWLVGSDAIVWSDELRRVLGFDPSRPSPVFATLGSSYRPESWALLQVAVEKAVNAGEPYEIELQMVRADGTDLWTNTRGEAVRDLSGKIVALRGTVLDISARKAAEKKSARLQAQLSQAQKMESVGLLAGGVAHDFNNMLGVILGLSELALDQVKPTDPLHADLGEIRKAAERSANLTSQLLTFGSRQTVAPKALDLNETLDGMLKMLRRLIGEDIDLAWQPGKDLWPVMVDPSQIDQVVANLCLNARDAIKGVGRISIGAENTSFAQSPDTDQDAPAPGDYVAITVRDDGCGMDEHTLRRVFEPFFTTKEMGRGTGLGLATVYGIVKQNNGVINVFSKPGEGTTFRIYLPRHAEESKVSRPQAPAAPAGRGSETILLVEDEIAVLDLAKRVLERLGYTVLAANTPAEAVRLADGHADGIDMLLTDVIMPEMSGRELATRLLARRQNLRCLFMSGYTADIIAEHGMLQEDVNFIQKPFTTKALAAKVREVLENGSKSPA